MRRKLAINLVEAFPRESRDILLSKTAIPFDTYASNQGASYRTRYLIASGPRRMRIELSPAVYPCVYPCFITRNDSNMARWWEL